MALSNAIDRAATVANPGSPERDFISWSQLSTFRQCPLRYHFRYDLRLPEEFTTSSLRFGSGIHRSIEMVHRYQLEGNRTPSLDDLVVEFWAEWKQRADDVPSVRFGKSEDTRSIDDLARRVLGSFLKSELS